MNLMSQLRNNKKTVETTAFERHDAFISLFLESLADKTGAGSRNRTISIIARSPESPVVKAIISRSDELKQHHASVQAIFADMSAEGALAEFSGALSGLNAGAHACDNIRWARNACLKDAHEQLILGTEMCWSGDCMRREPGKCNSLDLFEAAAPGVVRLGILAFDAIWAISEPVSASRLRASKPSAAYAAGHEARLSAFSFLRKSDRSSPIAH